MEGKTNLLGLTEKELADFAESVDEPRYRGKQLFGWLYERGVTDFRSMTDLAKSFRERLAAMASIGGIVPMDRQFSRQDGTTKFLFGLPDGLKIESVLIPPTTAFSDDSDAPEEPQRRLTLCVSTQVGCPLDCKFCATGTMGFFRNLTSGEIVDQVLHVRRLTGQRITNIVYMGMGEPLLNYERVMNAAEIFATGVGIAFKRITVSTAGWADQIRRLGDEKRRIKLAVSLHSAVDETRSRLMPINKKFPLAKLMDAVGHYYEQTRQRITYEFIFFDGINDTPQEVRRLIALARRVPSKINVIPYHSIDFTAPSGFAASLRPSPKTVAIVEELRTHNLTVFMRSSAGEDIDAACGQLAVRLERRRKAAATINDRGI